MVNATDATALIQLLARGTFSPEGDINQDGAVDFLDANALNQLILDSADLRGDVNKDGVVNATDATALTRLLTQGTFAPEGDLNEDGAVNFLDVSELSEILNNQ